MSRSRNFIVLSIGSMSGLTDVPKHFSKRHHFLIFFFLVDVAEYLKGYLIGMLRSGLV